MSTQLQRDNNLLACVCDDLTVRLVDIETKRIVREFAGFRGRVVDMVNYVRSFSKPRISVLLTALTLRQAFSNDSRWLLTTSTDSIIRTFDIPTGQLVDAFKTPSMATSITFSPTGDFLATSHVDSVGVYLWQANHILLTHTCFDTNTPVNRTNRAQFTEVSLRTIDEDEVLRIYAGYASLPTLQGEEGDVADLPTELTEEEADHIHLLQDVASEGQLESSLVTLTLMPRHKWQTLINLETITARNKPKEAPKAPEAAPFFLPTLPGTETRYDFASTLEVGKKSGTEQDREDDRKGRKLGYQDMEIDSELVSMLKKGSANDACEHKQVHRTACVHADVTMSADEAFFTRLFSLTPSALDIEIRSLSTERELILFVEALTARLASRKDFEAVQAVMNVFLSAHSEVLIGEGEDSSFGNGMDEDGIEEEKGGDELKQALQNMLDAQVKETKAIGNLVRSSLGMVAWARSVPVV